MKILLVSNLFPPDVLGGYELLARDVAQALRGYGYVVHVLTTGADQAEDPGWVHRRLRLVRAFGERASLDRVRHGLLASDQERATEQLIDELGPFDAAVVFSLRRLGLHAVRALQRRGVPVVFSFNDDWLLAHRPAEGGSPLKRAIWGLGERGRLAARSWAGVHFERAVYVSEALREAMKSAGAPVPEGVVSYQGVDRELFAARELRAVPKGAKLLFAGRLHETKACDVAIDALAELADREATLSVAGAGDQREALERRARERGVAERVHFLGQVDRGALPALMRAHDVFLFPSRWAEPLGLTYLEAISCGLPVVAKPMGGAAELLRDGENCIVAPDAGSMAAAVERLVAEPSLGPELVKAGQRMLDERASLERYVEAIERELVHAARSAHARDDAPRSVPLPKLLSLPPRPLA